MLPNTAQDSSLSECISTDDAFKHLGQYCTCWTSETVISMFLQCSCDTAGGNSVFCCAALLFSHTAATEHRLIEKSTSVKKTSCADPYLQSSDHKSRKHEHGAWRASVRCHQHPEARPERESFTRVIDTLSHGGRWQMPAGFNPMKNSVLIHRFLRSTSVKALSTSDLTLYSFRCVLGFADVLF